MILGDLLNSLTNKIGLLDAEILISYSLGNKREFLYSNPNHIISNTEFSKISMLLDKRLKGVPIAYLTKKKSFWKNEFYVNDSVLVPRPETETIMESILKEDLNNKVLLELGTGSGILSLSIAQENPSAVIFATDISIDALEVSKKNSLNMGCENVIFINHDWCNEWLFPDLDFIISNPPYVDKKSLSGSEDGLWYEPETALFSKEKGLFDLSVIIKKSYAFLKPQGKIFLEHAPHQKDAIIKMSKENKYRYIDHMKDLNKDFRVSIIQK